MPPFGEVNSPLQHEADVDRFDVEAALCRHGEVNSPLQHQADVDRFDVEAALCRHLAR